MVPGREVGVLEDSTPGLCVGEAAEGGRCTRGAGSPQSIYAKTGEKPEAQQAWRAA